MPAIHGEIVEMPMCNSSDVMHDAERLDKRGRAPPGTTYLVTRPSTSYREEGWSYLLSATYDPRDGLGQLRFAQSVDGSIPERTPAYAGPGLTLASQRWVTPHNPLPHPLEGITVQDGCLAFNVVSFRSDPTPAELFSGRVESRLGRFLVEGDSPPGDSLCHKSIPPHIWRELNKMDLKQRVFTKLEFKSIVTGTTKETAPPEVMLHTSVPGEEEEIGAVESAQKLEHPPDADLEGPVLKADLKSTGVKPTAPQVKEKNERKVPEGSSGSY